MRSKDRIKFGLIHLEYEPVLKNSLPLFTSKQRECVYNVEKYSA